MDGWMDRWMREGEKERNEIKTANLRYSDSLTLHM